MALTTVHWNSTVLRKKTMMHVLLPDVGKPPFATLYLLHGMSDDSSVWTRFTRLEMYVRDLPLMVVMPDGYRGFYTDNEEGPAYAQHIAEEVPAFVERHFQARPERAARAIGGLSMGGYGALRLGMGYADRFCSVHSHSGAVGWGTAMGVADLEKVAERRGWTSDFTLELKRIFGTRPHGTSHDLRWLASRAMAAGNLPELLLDCGTGDFLLEDNREMHRDFTREGVPHTYREFPGEHNWDYWDEHIREALEFHAKNLGLRVETEAKS